MPSDETTTIKIQFRLPGVAVSATASRAHGPATRGQAAEGSELLADLEVINHFDLSAPSRAARQEATLDAAEDDILALEMEDGFILYTSAARLADDLRRLDPAAERDGALRLDTLKQRGPATRGLGDWIVRAVSVLRLGKDKIIDAAVEKAKEWVGDQAADIIEKGASWAGTKALMWAIEQQLKPGPGLYRWISDDGEPSDLPAAKPADFQGWRPDDPILVFIHGTASSTLGSFGAFRESDSAREWQALHTKYGKHIYAYEHRTFSESPIENALGLAQALPAGARLSVVTHSRGGQVGDLLCLAGLGAERIASFRRRDGDLKEADEEDQRNLLALDRLLAEKSFRIERYVRVACPAQGTLLAGSNTDAFLSVLLHLIGLVPYLQVSPTYAVAKRVVLQIAKNRTDPRLVPGIEAMLPNSPLTALLGQAMPKDGAEIAVIAGDLEGGGLLKRIGVFLTDHIIFNQEDNDLVVDTDSMYGGLARERGRYLFDQGADVSHFRYFVNNRTRRALQDWLTQDKPTDSREFEPIQVAPQARKVRAPVTGPRPVVIFLPGILGSHLKVGEKDRVWFDFLDIVRGGLEKIEYHHPNISPDGLFEWFYGDLCDYLEDRHEVRRFAYDWRRPLRDEAARLAAEVEHALDATPLPVRLMTHSMGGLVVRTLIARHRPVWDRLMQRQDAYWVMLGVPNRGSHLIVETLLGLGDSPRQLALVDTKHDLQWLLDLMAAYPGMVQLLPRPGFGDTGDSSFDYYTDATWRDFKKANDSFWFGKPLGGAPALPLLADAKQSWEELEQNERLPNVERIAYVAGYGRETPCGIEIVKIGDHEQVRMIGTLNGDGSVTHDSGLLDCLRQNGRIWYMDADHVDLTNTPETFPALLELLERGETTRLPTTRPSLRGVEQTFRYEAGLVLYPTEQNLARALLGGHRPVRRRGRAKYTLAVSCRSMDLRYARDPILVGHYQGDAISAAEAQIDRYVVEGSLTRRHSLGLYAGAPGTATTVLLKPTDEQARAGIQHGAIVIGLGELGRLTTAALGEAVRNGVLRYLMQWVDREGGLRTDRGEATEVGLATLLLGYNSTTHISIEDSVSTIVRGAMVANRQFAEVMEIPLRVGRLEFIELYQDVAISIAHVVRQIGERLARESEVLGCRIEAAPLLECGEGLCPRLAAISGVSYWSRLIVSDAGRRDDLCPPECREDGARKPRPEDLNLTTSERLDQEKPTPAGELKLPTHPQRRPELARRLRFVFLSQRARAETVEHQRQPGLVETLVERSIHDSMYQPDLSRTLFQLLVPHDFKEVARQAANLVLVVDGYTANLPWEMLVADEKPLVLNTAMVRQLASTRFRPQVRGTLEKRAYVVGNPSTKGYYTAFPSPGMPDRDALDPLPGAVEEACAVAKRLRTQGYDVIEPPPDSEAVEIINKLFKYPYRIVHISAHGVFQAGAGEAARSGVVLSDGLLLTAAEMGQMEIVPDLVFLNCCFLGKTDNAPTAAYNRLAYSVARELIEIGVRAVVVAGWAVRDDAAKHFADVFYQSLLQRQLPFGEAIHEARCQTYQKFSDCNTWGAFQAYGDPSFAMDPGGCPARDGEDWNPVTSAELVARINQMKGELAWAKKTDGKLLQEQSARQLKALLKNISKDWLDLPEVLYALGRFHAESGAFEPAIRYYEQAIAIEDQRGQAPVVAIEQLANLEARQGEKKKDTDLVVRAIKRLQGLLNAADGAGEVSINSERCALLGSAYKRLARLLDPWSSDAGTEDQPAGVQQALEQAARWYQKGEGHPNQLGFSPYCAQNRLALQAVLGNTKLEEAALALQAGEMARQRYAHSRDYFDLIMAADGMLIGRLMDGSLSARPDDAEREILGCYRDIRERLPETERKLDSVVAQIRLLATFIEKRPAAEAGAEEPAKLAERLQRIADLLEGKQEAPDRKQPLVPVSSSPGSTTTESGETSPVTEGDVSSGGSTAVEESSGERPTGSSAKARKKRPE